MKVQNEQDRELIVNAFNQGKVVEMKEIYKRNKIGNIWCWCKVYHRDCIKIGGTYRVITIEIE